MNVWECDTKLDGLVKREKYEAADSEELFSGKKTSDIDDLNEKTENMDETTELSEQDPKKKFYIQYRKKSKYL